MKNNNSRPFPIVLVFFFIVFVLFFILELPFSIFPLIGLFPVISIFIVRISIASVSSGKSKCCKPERQKYDHYNQQQFLRVNPYIVRESVSNDVQTILVEHFKPIELTELKVLFCQFCGTRIDEDARFCHQCGSKLE